MQLLSIPVWRFAFNIFKRSYSRHFLVFAVTAASRLKCFSGINQVFSNKCGISGLLETWIIPDSPHLLQLFRIMLQHLSAVTLQRCFVDYETLPEYLLARWWVHNNFLHLRIRFLFFFSNLILPLLLSGSCSYKMQILTTRKLQI